MKLNQFAQASAILGILCSSAAMAAAPTCPTSNVRVEQNGGYTAYVYYKECNDDKNLEKTLTLNESQTFTVPTGKPFAIFAGESVELINSDITQDVVINCSGALGTSAKCDPTKPLTKASNPIKPNLNKK